MSVSFWSRDIITPPSVRLWTKQTWQGGSYLNLFPTKDKILLELVKTMFAGQFGVARSIADSKLPPVYAYAVETVLQLTLTELNENLREIYIEAYSLPETSEYIYLHTTAELKQIFGVNFPPMIPSAVENSKKLVTALFSLCQLYELYPHFFLVNY